MKHLSYAKWLGITLSLLFVVNLFPSDKAPFTLDDLYKIKSVSGPIVSPNHKHMLFTVSELDLPKGKGNNDLYLMDLTTKNIRQMTYSEQSEFNAFWSEDSKKIYFLSTRKDGVQLWTMDTHGGEARKVSSFETGLSSPILVPGTQKVLFSSYVYPECMADNDCNKKLADKQLNGPRQAHIGDNLLFRHWTSYRDWKYQHLFCLDLESGKVKALTEGKVDYPAFSLGDRGIDVAPDGKSVCLTSNHDKNAAHSTNSDLFLLDLTAKDAKPVNITADNKALDTKPLFSPNGRYVAYITQKIPGNEADKKRLAIYDIEAKISKILTESIDNWINSFQWSHDSRYIYFTMDEKGYTPLSRIDIKSGKVERLMEKQVIRGFEVINKGKDMVFRRTSVGEPYELWSYRFGKSKSKGPKRLTFYNQPLEEKVDIRPAEEHWTVGADGKQVHMFVVKPHNFDPNKKYPLIINIHGGPQMQWSDSFRGDWQVYPGAGYIVAFPNPSGSTGYGQEFTKAISRDWSGKVMEDIDKATVYLSNLPYVDKDRMGAMGWSWGGYAVMWLEGHNKHFKALASMMGVYDLRTMYSGTEELWFPHWDMGGKPWEKKEEYRKHSPSEYVMNYKTPCLVITGEKDYRVPYYQSLEFFTDLQEMGVDSRIIVFSNDGHWPNGIKSMPVYYNSHLEWFHKYLKGGKAPYDTEKLIRNLAFDDCEKKCETKCEKKCCTKTKKKEKKK